MAGKANDKINSFDLLTWKKALLKHRDKINSFDAMLSFLTWREALRKFREEDKVLKNPDDIEASKLFKKESKRVLAVMKFLYPLEFAKSGDSSFLEDFFSQGNQSQNMQVTTISSEIKKKIDIIKKLSQENNSKHISTNFSADTFLKSVFFDENLKNKIRANKNLSEFQDLDKELNLQSPYGFDVSQNNHKSFHEPVFLNPLYALYYTGLSALRAGIVSITNLCLPQQQASPKVDIIKASIEKLEKMPNSRGTQVYV